ncbi:MAG TPA: sugar ABC transporter permease [Ruminiclostridium sp.]
MVGRKGFWIAVFLIPTILIFIVIYTIPVLTVFFTSFYRWKNFEPMQFIGINNYINILTGDEDFRVSFTNTFKWLLLQSTVHVFIGTMIAIFLSHKIRGWKFIRTAYFLPNVISSAALGMLFLNIYNPQYGILNSFIRLLGFKDFSQNWFFDDKTAFFAVTTCWLFYAGYIVLLILAQIMTLPESIHEAAIVDGATQLQYDIFVVVPLIKNIIGTSTLFAATSMLTTFDMIYLTTNGGPMNVTLNLPLYIYHTAMIGFDTGYANTAATILIILGIFIVISINKIFKLNSTIY